MRNPLLLLVAVVVLGLGLWAAKTLQHAPAPDFAPSLSEPYAVPGSASAAEANAANAARSGRGTLPGYLPPEAVHTLELIARGGPYPYRKDGSVFHNRERLLPEQPRGYYREYTVDTPGLDHRGARRIVTGGRPPVEAFYTDDHYQSFRRFTLPERGAAHE